MVRTIRGVPARGRRFLWGMPLEPPRAGMMAVMFMVVP